MTAISGFQNVTVKDSECALIELNSVEKVEVKCHGMDGTEVVNMSFSLRSWQRKTSVL